MTNQEKPSVLLIDGSSFLFRSYHAPALTRLTSPDGQPTGAMFGVNRMIDQMLTLYPTDKFIVVFDPRGKTRRHQWLETYKANRPPTPADLIQQFQPLIQIIKARGIPVITVDGEEADDVIGTLTYRFHRKGYRVFIATGDKDMAQLVNDDVKLVNSIKNQMSQMNSAGVFDKFGVRPNQIADYLALVGDSADNIPGVPGVGAKTAARLLQKYDSLDGIVSNFDEIPGKVGNSLKENVERFPLLKKLTTIICDLDLGVDIDDLTVTEPNIDSLRVLYQQYGFTASLRALEKINPPVAETNDRLETNVTWLTPDNFAAMTEKLEAPLWCYPVTVAQHWQPEILAFIIGDNTQTGILLYDQSNWLDRISEWVHAATASGSWYCHDFKHLLHCLGWQGTLPETDLMLASYVLNSASKHDLISLSAQWAPNFGEQLNAMRNIASKQDADQIKKSDWLQIAAELGQIMPNVYQMLSKALGEDQKRKDLLNNMELPLSYILWQIEATGVGIDKNALLEFSYDLNQSIETLQADAFALAKEPFNLDSPKQIREVLFERMGLPTIKKTASGEASTNEEVLQHLANKGHEIASIIIQRRQKAKLKSTYTDALQKHIDNMDQRIHSHFNQAIANTGRLSSSHPNLQNIPIKGEDGKRLRKSFIATMNRKLLSADYSQIELRILAHMCDDQNMQKAFAEGKDIHSATASELFHIAVDEITSDQRRYAKTINFGLIYGMGAFSLSNQLGVDRKEAEEYIKLYFLKYPNVLKYMEESRQFAKNNGYIETFLGRKITLPDINSKHHAIRQYAERAAINAPIQGAAADIIKMAMISMYELLHAETDILMTLQIHDELLFEVDASMVEHYSALIRKTMEGVTTLKVPLKVDIGIGDNWAQAH